MNVRAYYQVLGGHVHIRVFGPGVGKSGDLIVQVDEFEAFRGSTRWHWEAEERPEPQPGAGAEYGMEAERG